MKKYILLIFVSIATFSMAQDTVQVDFGGYPNPGLQNFLFENNASNNYFYFDSTEANNIWQIGHPSKTNFTNGYLSNRALVTDSVNPYPANNTSTFYMNILHTGIGWTDISFWYKIDTDTITDGGTIEISFDGGTTWFNSAESPIISGTFYYTSNLYGIADTITSLGKPGVSGTNNWQRAFLSIFTPNSATTPANFQLKFSFASDGASTTPKDGWIIDDFQVNANMEGINEHYMNNDVSVYPNPANSTINYSFFKKLNSPTDVALYNSSGEKVIHENNLGNGSLDVSNLDEGIYFAIFKNRNFYETKKIIIQK